MMDDTTRSRVLDIAEELEDLGPTMWARRQGRAVLRACSTGELNRSAIVAAARELADSGPNAWSRRCGRRLLRLLGAREHADKVEMMGRTEGRCGIISFTEGPDDWWRVSLSEDMHGSKEVAVMGQLTFNSLLHAQQAVRDAGWYLEPV